MEEMFCFVFSVEETRLSLVFNTQQSPEICLKGKHYDKTPTGGRVRRST